MCDQDYINKHKFTNHDTRKLHLWTQHVERAVVVVHFLMSCHTHLIDQDVFTSPHLHAWTSLLDLTFLPFYFDLTSPVLMHPEPHTDLDNLNTVQHNLRASAKGSNDAYDVLLSLTGYEPNDMVFSELVKGMYPAPDIHEHFKIHKWLRQTAYIFTHNFNSLEHIATNCMNVMTHTDVTTAHHWARCAAFAQGSTTPTTSSSPSQIHDGSGKPEKVNSQERTNSKTFLTGSDAAEFVNKVTDQVRSRQKKSRTLQNQVRLQRWMRGHSWERISQLFHISSWILKI